jgi:hypothetical protein
MPRPKAEVDPKRVLALASEGAKVTEIADELGVSRDVLHDRFATELRKGRAARNQSLRRAQLKAATDGNATMLIWLGKQYLGQSDKTIDDYLLEAINEAGITKEDLVEMIRNRDQLAGKSGEKKSFEEFVKSAGYPPPFAKQVDMVKFARELTGPGLLLGSRNYGKTDYVTILGVAYEVYLEPELATFLLVTKSKERNGAILNEIKQACSMNGVIFDRANATHLRARGLGGKDHSVSAVTLKTSTLRGRHPRKAILDDPVTDDDTSDAARAIARKKYDEILKLCKVVLAIGQPAHQFDLYADLRGKIATMEVPYGSIPELDVDLEAQRIAGVDEATIKASYFLKIDSVGKSPFNAVKYIDKFPPGQSVAFIDPSEGGDYTAVTILKMHLDGIAVVGFVYKRAWNHCLDDMLPELRKFGVMKVCFETNKHGEQAVELLQSLFQGSPGVVGRHSSRNKHARIMAAGVFAHRIHLSKESHKLFIDHVVRYEYKAKFDDAPDSLASCMEWIGLVKGKEDGVR